MKGVKQGGAARVSDTVKQLLFITAEGQDFFVAHIGEVQHVFRAMFDVTDLLPAEANGVRYLRIPVKFDDNNAD